MVSIITCARELGISIQESAEFQRLQTARDIQQSDDDLQEKIQEFNLMRQKHTNEQNKQDNERNDVKIAETEQQIRRMYDEIRSIPIMKEYLDAKNAMDKIMGEVNSIINYYLVGDEGEGCGGEPVHECGGCGKGCGGKNNG